MFIGLFAATSLLSLNPAWMPPADEPSFEVLGTFTSPGESGLQPNVGVPIRSVEDVRSLMSQLDGGDSLGVGTDIVELITETYATPADVPAGTLLVVADLGSNCFPIGPIEVVVDDLGSVTVTADPGWDDSGAVCDQEISTIALIAVETGDNVHDDADIDVDLDAEPMSVAATLIAFEDLGPMTDPVAVAVELDEAATELLDLEQLDGAADLPDLEAGMRRFAFVRTAPCSTTGAELLVTPTSIDALFVDMGAAICSDPELFLAVFDVPDDEIPTDAVLEGNVPAR